MSETIRTLTAFQKLLDGEWKVAATPDSEEALMLYSTYCGMIEAPPERDINLNSVVHIKGNNPASCRLLIDPDFLNRTWEKAWDIFKPFTIPPLEAIGKLLVFPNSTFEYTTDGVLHKMDWKELTSHGIPYKALTTKWRQAI